MDYEIRSLKGKVNNLRMVSQMNCYGKFLNDDWEVAGAKSGYGHMGLSISVPYELLYDDQFAVRRRTVGQAASRAFGTHCWFYKAWWNFWVRRSLERSFGKGIDAIMEGCRPVPFGNANVRF